MSDEVYMDALMHEINVRQQNVRLEMAILRRLWEAHRKAAAGDPGYSLPSLIAMARAGTEEAKADPEKPVKLTKLISGVSGSLEAMTRNDLVKLCERNGLDHKHKSVEDLREMVVISEAPETMITPVVGPKKPVFKKPVQMALPTIAAKARIGQPVKRKTLT
jgi:hypothetical protein